VAEQRPRPYKARYVGGAIILAVALLITCGHMLALSRPALLIFSRLFDIFLIIFLTILAISLGEGLLKLLRIETASYLERTVFAFGLGLGVISYSLLLLALLHLLYPLAIFVLLGLLFIISIKPMASWLSALPREAKGALRELKSFWLVLYIALAIITIAAVIIRALLPPSDYDSLMYHLPTAQGFLRAHTIIPFYDNFGANFPASMQLVYAVGVAAKSDALAQALSTMTAFFTALAMGAFGARFFSRRLGFIVFCVFWAAGVVAETATTSHVDLNLTFYIFLGIYAVFIHLERNDKTPAWRNGWLIIGAIAIGFALATKYTALFWLGAIPLWLGWERLVRWREGLRRWLAAAFIFVLLAVAVAGYWYVKNWLWLDNPVYPFYFGGKGVDTFLLQELKQGTDDLGSGRGLKPLFINLWELFTEPTRFDLAERHSINYLFILLPIYLLLKKNHRLNIFFFLSGLYYVYWTLTVQSIRYLLPVFPLLSLTTAYILDEAIKPRRRFRFLKNAVPLAALVIMSLNAKLQYHMTKNLTPWRYLAGLESKEYILTECEPYSAFLPSVAYINTKLPPTAKILMLYEARTFYIKPSTIPDLHNLTWNRLVAQSSSNEEIYQALRSQGITHLLFNDGLLEWRMRRGQIEKAEAQRQRQFLRSFARDYLRLQFKARMFELYSLTTPPSS